MVMPVAMRFFCFCSEFFRLIEKLERALSISIPEKISTPEPTRDINQIENCELMKRVKPKIMHIIIPASRRECPRIISGPDFAPCFVLS